MLASSFSRQSRPRSAQVKSASGGLRRYTGSKLFEKPYGTKDFTLFERKPRQGAETAQTEDVTLAGKSVKKIEATITGTDIATTGIVLNYSNEKPMTPVPGTVTVIGHGRPGSMSGVPPEQVAGDIKQFKGWEKAGVYTAVCSSGSGVLGKDGKILIQPYGQRLADALGRGPTVFSDPYRHIQQEHIGTQSMDSWREGKSNMGPSVGIHPTVWRSFRAGEYPYSAATLMAPYVGY